MAPADLSQFLTALDSAVAHSDFDGLALPDIAPGDWSRTIPAKCAGCWKANSNHKCYRGAGFGPASASKAILEKLIDHSNDVRERTRLWRSMVQLMHLAIHGVLNINLPVGRDNASNAYSWPVSSVSGGWVTLTYAAGTSDPRALAWTHQVLDPLYPSPGHEAKYITETIFKAIKARGMLTFGYPSMLRNFEQGWIVQRLEVPAGLALGGTFRAKLEGDFSGSAALTEYPEDTGETIKASIRIYAEAADEPWTAIRDCYPFWAEKKTITINNPTATFYTLEYSKRIKKPTSGWWLAVDQAGNPVALENKVSIYQSGSSWATYLNLYGVNLTGITALTLTYWVESTAATAINAGQNRCKYSTLDPTGSWGEVDGDGRYHYCAKRNELSGTNYETNYRAECYQTACPYFAEGDPSDPLAAIEQLIYSYPWREDQVTVGDPTVLLYRHGTPSLYSLTRTLREPPVGLYPRKAFIDQVGGWERARIFDDVVTGDPGFEMIRNNPINTAVDINVKSSWPEFGPGGDLIDGRRTDYGAGAANDTTDPHLLERQTPIIGGLDLDPYTGTTSGSLGKRQRIGVRRWKAFLPALGSGATIERDDGTVYRGSWDAALQPCAEEDAVWRVRIVLKAPMWSAYGGAVRTATIAAASYLGYGLALELENGVLSAKSPILVEGEPVETTTSWRQGATNVAGPEFWRVWNYFCSQTRHGPMRGMIRRGHVGRFTGAAFAGHALYGRNLWVMSAEAYAGAGGSWKVDPATPGTEISYYAGNISPHGAGLPQMHYSYANRRDVILLLDSGGIVGDFTSAEGAGALVGETIEIRDDGLALEGGTVYTSARGCPDEDVQASGAKFLGAQGEIFLESLDDEDACAMAAAFFAERDCGPSVHEFEAIDAALGNMVGE